MFALENPHVKKITKFFKFYTNIKKVFFLLQIIWSIEKIDFRGGPNVRRGGDLWGGKVKMAFFVPNNFFSCSKSSETSKKSILGVGPSETARGKNFRGETVLGENPAHG